MNFDLGFKFVKFYQAIDKMKLKVKYNIWKFIINASDNIFQSRKKCPSIRTVIFFNSTDPNPWFKPGLDLTCTWFYLNLYLV